MLVAFLSHCLTVTLKKQLEPHWPFRISMYMKSAILSLMFRKLLRFFFIIKILTFSSASGMIQKEDIVHLQIITVKTEADLNEILLFLKSGKEFSELAQRYSTHATANNGGYLGQLHVSDLATQLRKKIEGVQQGVPVHFLDPDLGYTIIRKLDSTIAKSAYSKQSVVRGANYLKGNATNEAIREFRQALSLDPQSSEAHILLGYTYRLLGSYEMIGEAKAEFQQGLAIDPTSAWARLHLAKIYLDLGFVKKAKEVLEERLEVTENVPQLLSFLGEVNRQLGQPQLSVQQNKRALQMDSLLTPAHYYLGRAYLDLANDREGLQELDIALRSHDATSDMYLAAGSLYLEKKQLDKATELLEKATRINPSLPEGHLTLAKVYRLKGLPELALNQLARAQDAASTFSASPNYLEFQLEIYSERGMAYQERGLIAKALEAYLKALDVKPNHGQTHRLLAEALFLNSEYDRSLQHALKARNLGSPVDESLFEKIVQKSKGAP